MVGIFQIAIYIITMPFPVHILCDIMAFYDISYMVICLSWTASTYPFFLLICHFYIECGLTFSSGTDHVNKDTYMTYGVWIIYSSL